MKRLMAGALACAASCAMVTSAQAAPTTFYFDCNSSNPLQNTTPGSSTWSTTPPAQSYQAGAGCVDFDPGLLINDPKFDMFLGGSYGGEVRKLVLNLYSITQGHPLVASGLLPKEINLTLNVGDNTLTDAADYKATPEATATQGVYKESYDVTELEIPATATAQPYSLEISSHYSDDFTLWAWGAAEVPASITAYGWCDLTSDEQQQIIDDGGTPGPAC